MPCATKGYLLDLSIKHKRQGDEVKNFQQPISAA